jgi:hypothetical protein
MYELGSLQTTCVKLRKRRRKRRRRKRRSQVWWFTPVIPARGLGRRFMSSRLTWATT